MGSIRSFVECRGVVFAATEGGVFRFDGLTSWTSRTFGLPLTDATSLACLGRYLFVGIRGAGVFRSVDSGAHWVSSGAGITDSVIESMTNRDSILFAGTNSSGVFRSLDSGTTWSATAPMGGSWQPALSLLAVRNTIFAGTGDGVSSSTDDGDHWISRNAGIGFGYIQGIVDVGDTLFACSGSGGGIYRSVDSARSWTEADSGLGNYFVNGITSFGGIIFAGSQRGLYRSANDGGSWTLFDSSLAGTFIQSLFARGTRLFVGTSAGIRLLPLAAVVTSARPDIAAPPHTCFLYPNYPNPFNPSTTIGYILASRAPVLLSVYNALGQQVAELVNSVEEPGIHTVTFNAGGLASGVYLCRLQVGTLVRARKLVLLR
jgi:hypothetical protein